MINFMKTHRKTNTKRESAEGPNKPPFLTSFFTEIEY